MRDNLIAGSIVVSIFIVFISVFAFLINSVKSYKCESTAKALNVGSEYSWSTGCILVKQDGTKTPLYLQRFIN